MKRLLFVFALLCAGMLWADPLDFPARNSQWGKSGSAVSYTGGNVGIGTSAPTSVLHVVGDAQFYNDMKFLQSGNTIYQNATNGTLQIKSNGSGALKLNYNNAGNVEIAVGGGNVGIGTTAPGAVLDVQGTARVKAGAGTLNANLGGVVYLSTISVTTTDTSEQNISTVTIPANTLNRTGQALKITAWGTHAANSNNASLKLSLDGETIGWDTVRAASGGKWHGQSIAVRAAAGTVIYSSFDTNDTFAYTDGGTTSVDLTADFTINILMTTGTQAGDLTVDGMMVEILN